MQSITQQIAPPSNPTHAPAPRASGRALRALRLALALAVPATLLAACATTHDPVLPQKRAPLAASSAEAPPVGKLPTDVTPLSYVLDLDIDPRKERFSGTVDIEMQLDKARDVIWMHGAKLHVSAVLLRMGETVASGTFEQVNDEGLARLKLDQKVGPGRAIVRMVYDAPFDKELKGLYKVVVGEDSYAFTQFEATSARFAFPCFDEPRFKTPFDVSVLTTGGDLAVSNTLEQPSTPVDDKSADAKSTVKKVRNHFATTQNLPTYLLAFSVGPLEIIDGGTIAPNAFRKKPLRLRGVAVKGRGKKLAYALAHTPDIITTQETYFGRSYPFDKLDLIAVPDFAAGAMENPGAVTFREFLLFVDPATASVGQRRAFLMVTAHELAHMWFGDLVTMPWWDDIWLNEAFATWMAYKTVGLMEPGTGTEVRFLKRVYRAFSSDSMVSARQIRQPIESDHDIENAFDAITYSKGGGVLGMLERWLGPDIFRDGIRAYLQKHAYGNATYQDLLGALSTASGKDVLAVGKTFLFQPGIPFIEASLDCSGAPKLKLHQSRYLPVGSKGNAKQTWQLPICVAYGQKKGGERQTKCTRLKSTDGEIPLDSCPSWVHLNANGAGYYRWAVSPELFGKALAAPLTIRERISAADSIGAAFNKGTLKAGDALALLGPLAKDKNPEVVSAPMGILRFARRRLVTKAMRPAVEAFASALYAPALKELGFQEKASDDDDAKTRRAAILGFLVDTARDKKVIDVMAKKGRAYVGFGGDGKIHKEALSADSVGPALNAAMLQGDAKFFDHLMDLLKTEVDPVVRRQLIGPLHHTTDPTLAARARELTLDARLHTNEINTSLFASFAEPDEREAAWAWTTSHIDALTAILPTTRKGVLPWTAASFCSEKHAKEAKAFFAGRVAKLPGGPRNLQGALEAISLCAAQVAAHQESARAFFAPAASSSKTP